MLIDSNYRMNLLHDAAFSVISMHDLLKTRHRFVDVGGGWPVLGSYWRPVLWCWAFGSAVKEIEGSLSCSRLHFNLNTLQIYIDDIFVQTVKQIQQPDLQKDTHV